MGDKIIPMNVAGATVDENTSVSKIETSLVALAALIEGGRLKVDAAGVTLTVDNLEFDVSELATAAGQASILAALGKGQALAAASLPVVLPALQETALKAVTEASSADIKAALLGTGQPIPRQFADPGTNDYTAAATAPGRACSVIRFSCGANGMIISLDDGTTESIRVPANTVDSISVSIAADAAIKAKRLTAGSAFAGAWIEVR